MKFCSKCGAELFDDAVVCVKCGRAVGVEKAEEKIDKKDEVPTKKASMLVSVFGFVSTVFTALALFFLFISIFDCYIDVERNYVSVYSTSYSADFYLNARWFCCALISSVGSLGCALTAFIISLAKKQKGERLLLVISRLIFGVLLFVICGLALTEIDCLQLVELTRNTYRFY